MRAMLFERSGEPLRRADVAPPRAGAGQLLIRVRACGVCRTDLHLVDGELPDPKRPVVPGHEIVGTVIERGAGAERFAIGERVGVPWLGWTCGECFFCRRGEENLCDRARFHGYTLDGGYAELVVADARYCFRLPERYRDEEAAPLLCAGLIGYRAYAMTGGAERIGLYGFGASAHLIAQVARADGRRLFAFTRPGDEAAQRLARTLGAEWAGGSDQAPPEPLDAAILFAPVGALVPAALERVRKGGVVVCAGIHMSDIPAFPYRLLWGERVVRSVANLTRADGEALLARAAAVRIESRVEVRPLDQANRALDDLRAGRVTGALVLTI
jgi:propanol-preferring alcohol dehydrogenase